MDDPPKNTGKTLRDYNPSEPKGLTDNRRTNGGEVLQTQPTELPRDSPRHSTVGNAYSKRNEAHPWAVSPGAEGTWNVVGGVVYSQGSPITVPDTVITGDAGFAVLEITRAGSREASGATIVWAASVATSTESTQYRALAKLDPDNSPNVLQLQFEEIRIYELMIVENGEFAMMGAEMSHRNTYAPPP